jgi:hypothetical protein
MVAIVVAVANTVVAKVIVMEAVATVAVTVTTAVAVGPSHVVSCVPCYWYS